MPVSKDCLQFVHFHVELVKFFYHFYASDISKCQEDVTIQSVVSEDFNLGESKFVQVTEGEEQLIQLDSHSYPHDDALKSTQVTLLEQIQVSYYLMD